MIIFLTDDKCLAGNTNFTTLINELERKPRLLVVDLQALLFK